MSRGTIFVTGASTGIGHATALRLANAGYTVIPGLRRNEPLPQPVAEPVLLDLADPDTLEPACKEVLRRADGNLVGLVNNAGMTVSGAFEGLTLDDWRRQFEINFFGHIAITQNLLPELLANKGRIVTVGSIGGRMALPFMGPYTSSKHAVHGWMDSLRVELAPHGVHAILVEPGAIATPLWQKGTSEALERLEASTSEIRHRYERHVNGALKAAEMSEKNAIPPDRAAKVIEKALTSSRPRGRYLVGPDARVQAVIAKGPAAMVDGVIGLITKPRD
ncbi:MAG TPA: SDR family oxidoreductase [Mycobacteriales bacterium]|nr:SDR family oxidoreductase [Mycobacteriales bacterium]